MKSAKRGTRSRWRATGRSRRTAGCCSSTRWPGNSGSGRRYRGCKAFPGPFALHNAPTMPPASTIRRFHGPGTTSPALHRSQIPPPHVKHGPSLKIRVGMHSPKLFTCNAAKEGLGFAAYPRGTSSGARVVEWQTRMFEGHVGQPVGVRVPPRAPTSWAHRLNCRWPFFCPLPPSLRRHENLENHLIFTKSHSNSKG